MHELVNLRRILETAANGYVDPHRGEGFHLAAEDERGHRPKLSFRRGHPAASYRDLPA